MQYRNLVFDVGSVLLSYQWREMMIEYGMSEQEVDGFYEMMFHDPLWEQFDLENWSYDEVGAKFIEKNPEHAEDIRYFLFHKDRMPVARPGVYERIARLKEMGYRIYLLSNYSSVLFAAHTRLIPFMDELDGMVVSYQIHIGKPDPRIYHALFDRYGLVPGECLFFDDRQGNVDGAKACGMDAVLVTSEKMLEKELSKMIEQSG